MSGRSISFSWSWTRQCSFQYSIQLWSWGDRRYLDCLPAQFWGFPEAFWFLSAESTRMGENKHSRHQAEAEKDSRFGVICHCIVWHLWGGFTYDVLNTYGYDEDSFNCQVCSPRYPVSEPPPASVSHSRLSTDLPSYSDFPEPLLVQRKLRISLPAMETMLYTCSWRLQQSSPWRLHV